MALLLLPALVRADETPKDLPVTLTLVAKKTTYPLDLGGKTADDFKKALKAGEADLKSLPPLPQVDLVLELKNTSKKDVQVWISGSPVLTGFELKGPGAVTVTPRQAFPRLYIEPKAVGLAPGKTYEIKVPALSYGNFGRQHRAYWTEPGDYTLGATLATAISPAPEGTKTERMGFGRVTLKAEPIKLKVEAK
jgi:hypothetical protein